tara:strand:- start:92 stop:505 length:414 start_codon:yes stop_codon:yes gene_type:complete
MAPAIASKRASEVEASEVEDFAEPDSDTTGESRSEAAAEGTWLPSGVLGAGESSCFTTLTGATMGADENTCFSGGFCCSTADGTSDSVTAGTIAVTAEGCSAAGLASVAGTVAGVAATVAAAGGGIFNWIPEASSRS